MPERYFEAHEQDGAALPAKEDGSVEFCDVLSPRQLLNERIMTALRMAAGVALEDLELGDFAENVQQALQEGILRGWLVDDPMRILPTAEGRRHADSVAELFF